MEAILLVTIFISFFCTYLTMPFWIRKARRIGLVWRDMNKPKQLKNIAGSGGLVVVFGFLLGVLLYIAIKTFYFKNDGEITSYIFAIFSVLFFSLIVGFVDDLFGWQKGGLSVRSRVLLILLAAIPLVVINAGESTVLGINLGILYPLIVVPVGVLGATMTFNMLAGYNGLEAGQGIIILSALAIVTFLTGNSWLSIVALCMVASLFAFYIFNRNPAKIFPGDVLTYAVGALIASIAILGNIEKIALFFFIPYFLEVILKIRGKINIKSSGFVQNFGVPNSDGSLELRYKKIYSVTHLALFILKKFKKKVYENDVTHFVYMLQIVIVLLGFLFFL